MWKLVAPVRFKKVSIWEGFLKDIFEGSRILYQRNTQKNIKNVISSRQDCKLRYMSEGKDNFT